MIRICLIGILFISCRSTVTDFRYVHDTVSVARAETQHGFESISGADSIIILKTDTLNQKEYIKIYRPSSIIYDTVHQTNTVLQHSRDTVFEQKTMQTGSPNFNIWKYIFLVFLGIVVICFLSKILRNYYLKI